MVPYKYICVEGNIGAGKTTLAHDICKKTGATLVLEEFEKNPFLPSFYEDNEKFALQTEMYFLHQRFRQLTGIFQVPANRNGLVISDYFLAKSKVFGRVTLSGHELELFEQYVDLLLEQVVSPDLIVFINRDIAQLQHNISARARAIEAGIKGHYLQRLKQAYEDYFAKQSQNRVVIVSTKSVQDNTNVLNSADLLSIIEREWPLGITDLSL
ncbi:MAG: deoxynucleoside kinase [Flavobacteriales bacterium]